MKWYSPLEAQQCLAGKRVTFAGDSMVRQMYVRLINYIRGFSQHAEHKFHHHSSYQNNGTHDLFLALGSHFPHRQVRGLRLEPEGWRKTMELEFLWQTKHLLPVTAIQAQQPDVLVTSVMYHTHDNFSEVDVSDWLLNLAQSTSLQGVYWVAGPVRAEWKQHVSALHLARDSKVRGAVQAFKAGDFADSMDAHVLPLDIMAQAGPYEREPTGPHFGCIFGNVDVESPLEAGMFVKQPPNGDCRDLLNLNLVQLLLNSICTSTAQGGSSVNFKASHDHLKWHVRHLPPVAPPAR